MIKEKADKPDNSEKVKKIEEYGPGCECGGGGKICLHCVAKINKSK